MALYNSVIDFSGGEFLGVGFDYRVRSHAAGGSKICVSYQMWRIYCPLTMQDSARVVAVNPIEKINFFSEIASMNVSIGRDEGNSEQRARRSVVAEMPSQV